MPSPPPRSAHNRRRLIAGAATASAAGAATAALARRRAAIARVAPELRNPLLYLPISVRNRMDVALARVVSGRATSVAPGVDAGERRVPGPAGARDVGVLTYESPDRPRPSGALLWIHGGGFVIGSPRQSNATCSRFARDVGLLVASVDYRLAPEHPFPAGLEDCYAALEWLHAKAESLDVDPGRIAVGGESAGGGLAATLCQLARERGGPPIAFQLLVYPMLDDATVLRSDGGGTGRFVWTPASNRYGWTAYLGHPPSETGEGRPFAVASRCDDLAGLPPAWIGVGDRDLFCAEDVAYAQRLWAAGVPCGLEVVAGMYHGADLLRPRTPSMRSFRESMTAALRAGLGV